MYNTSARLFRRHLVCKLLVNAFGFSQVALTAVFNSGITPTESHTIPANPHVKTPLWSSSYA